MRDSPELLVVAGANGVGKTTLAHRFARENGLPYVGADAIAESMSASDPSRVRMAAGRQFLRLVDERLTNRESMVIETTLSGRSFRRTISKARKVAFDITIVYLFLETDAACIARVRERIQKGGHHMPDTDVRRRFTRSVVNFWTIYREMADNWVLMYNGMGRLQDVAVGSGKSVSVRDTTAFDRFTSILEANDDD